MNLTYERNIKLLDTLESRERLRSILADPVFLTAMAVIQEDCRVKQPDLEKLIDLTLTRRTAYHAGVSEVCEKLNRLTRASNGGLLSDEDEEPFEYLTAQDQ
jgi:hypothetical protein